MFKMLGAIVFSLTLSACLTSTNPPPQEPRSQLCSGETKESGCFSGRAIGAKGVIREKEFELFYESPKDWVLDTETLPKNIPLWFPASSKNPMDDCFIYFRFDTAKTVDELVKRNLSIMKTTPDGDPDLEATEISTGTTSDGRPIKTFAYTGRRDQRLENVSYILEKKFVQFLVLNCPSTWALKAGKTELEFMITRLRQK